MVSVGACDESLLAGKATAAWESELVGEAEKVVFLGLPPAAEAFLVGVDQDSQLRMRPAKRFDFDSVAGINFACVDMAVTVFGSPPAADDPKATIVARAEEATTKVRILEKRCAAKPSRKLMSSPLRM